MTKQLCPQEPERKANQLRSMSTLRTKAGDPQRRDKVCLQLVKINIVTSYDSYNFDLYF